MVTNIWQTILKAKDKEQAGLWEEAGELWRLAARWTSFENRRIIYQAQAEVCDNKVRGDRS